MYSGYFFRLGLKLLFASLRSTGRRTLHDLYLQHFWTEVSEKGGGHLVALIGVGMHLIECNPGRYF